MNTATNQGAIRLFPDRRAGQPMTPDALSAPVKEDGVTASVWAAAIRQHVMKMSAPSSLTPSPTTPLRHDCQNRLRGQIRLEPLPRWRPHTLTERPGPTLNPNGRSA